MINGGYQIIDFKGLDITKDIEGSSLTITKGSLVPTDLFSLCGSNKPTYLTGIDFKGIFGVMPISIIAKNQTIPCSIAGNKELGYTILVIFNGFGVTRFTLIIEVKEDRYDIQVFIGQVN